MNLFSENGIYEVVYRGSHFSFLRFIRMDNICDVCYITLKNILTGEMFTFEQAGVLAIRETTGAIGADNSENEVA
ncbi:hypothetical protein WQ57_11455 [Mesobacillus campisalis]|uniref:Uncharacterized protein n=1 Tax=Mesobacillus campisalis TaxID=1408103 RepID=A0A0M2SXS5_9BACI|nr:hypothetical protein [Mesobacillus campisalis]KKK37787.1 hypothetical protein WQ57_11455 [Mesobacillus campisalis]